MPVIPKSTVSVLTVRTTCQPLFEAWLAGAEPPQDTKQTDRKPLTSAAKRLVITEFTRPPRRIRDGIPTSCQHPAHAARAHVHRMKLCRACRANLGTHIRGPPSGSPGSYLRARVGRPRCTSQVALSRSRLRPST